MSFVQRTHLLSLKVVEGLVQADVQLDVCREGCFGHRRASLGSEGFFGLREDLMALEDRKNHLNVSVSHAHLEAFVEVDLELVLDW